VKAKMILYYTIIVTIAATTLLAAYSLTTITTTLFQNAYAKPHHEKGSNENCDNSDKPPFKALPDVPGPTGNPHTCQHPTGNPHVDDEGIKSKEGTKGNPHLSP